MKNSARDEETRAVVVGVDGSKRCIAAVQWAAHAAHDADASLRIVSVVGDNEIAASDMRVEAPASWAPAAAERARVVATQTCPELRVDKVTRFGRAGPVLAQEDHGSLLVVVGRRGGSSMTERLLGSTAISTVKHAHSPAVVVPASPMPHSHDPVVVGLGSDGDDEVLEAAFREAQRLRVPLRAIRTWTLPPEFGWDTAILYDEFPRRQREPHRALGELVEPWAAKYADVPIEMRVEHGIPAVVLKEAAAHASVVVIGNRGERLHRPQSGLGSVARSVLHHATSPVMVVRAH
jgi:nucleotide-binding universal stress UspA family protein